MDDTAGIRESLLALIGAALLFGVVLSLISSGPGKDGVKLLCGLLLLLTAGKYLTALDLPDLGEYYVPELEDAETAVQSGLEMSQEAVNQIIKEQVEAYILDKATALGAQIQTDVEIGQDQLPEYIWIQGEVSAQIRTELEQILCQDLGITKEALEWSG